jgi:hypothetical protein
MDRPGHSGSRIWVPAFVDNQQLHPKTAITIYLRRTEQFRSRSNNDQTSLFFIFHRAA